MHSVLRRTSIRLRPSPSLLAIPLIASRSLTSTRSLPSPKKGDDQHDGTSTTPSLAARLREKRGDTSSPLSPSSASEAAESRPSHVFPDPAIVKTGKGESAVLLPSKQQAEREEKWDEIVKARKENRKARSKRRRAEEWQKQQHGKKLREEKKKAVEAQAAGKEEKGAKEGNEEQVAEEGAAEGEKASSEHKVTSEGAKMSLKRPASTQRYLDRLSRDDQRIDSTVSQAFARRHPRLEDGPRKELKALYKELLSLRKIRVLWPELPLERQAREAERFEPELRAEALEKRAARQEATLADQPALPLLQPAEQNAGPSDFGLATVEATLHADRSKEIQRNAMKRAKAAWPAELKKIRAQYNVTAQEIRRRLNLTPLPKRLALAPSDKEAIMVEMADTLDLSAKKPDGERSAENDTARTKEKKEGREAKKERAAEPDQAAEGGKGRSGRPARRVGGAAAAAAAGSTAASSRYSFYAALQPSSDPVPPPPPRDLSSYPFVLSPSSVPFTPHPSPLGDVPIATLAHSLDRVLFNPGVHFLRDPRTGVYNFDPSILENVPKVDEFAFDKLPQYVTSSKDEILRGITESEGRMFAGSTSSTVGMLCQIYFWLSKGKKVNLEMLSGVFRDMDRDFSMGQKLPVSVVLHHDNGRYAIDADKSFDAGIDQNILAHYGHLMEKLLTTDGKEFQRFLVDAEDPAPSEADHRQAYHYALTDHLVLRSQLDAHNPHLPNKTFDLKTRGTVAIRQDRLNFEESAGYVIDRVRGPWESFEREYYDLIRSAFLKYQFQARIGHMDGVLVAYHATARFYGFQYVPISEMDEALFGNSVTGEQCFRLALGVLERGLQEAAACYPGESVNVTWAADVDDDVLRLFVSPQREVEAFKVEKAKEDEAEVEPAEGGSNDASTAAAQDSATTSPVDGFASKLPMTLLEIRGTSYLDGRPYYSPVTIPPPRIRDGEAEPTSSVWQLGFKVTKSTGNDLDPSTPEPVPAHRIASLFAATRRFQTMFSTLALPTGVSVNDVKEAAKQAEEAGVELDPSDLSVRFPAIEGVEYRGPSRAVKDLRKKAREGEKRRVEEEERRRALHGEKQRRVQVVSHVEVVEE
ncbi:hypothetical protein JCM8097_004639 [Rhodosporidiobolus ruineniae]